MQIIDCSPSVGEYMDRHPSALVIAKHLRHAMTDMNEYSVLCIRNAVSEYGPEYVVWSMYGREDEWVVEQGDYFLLDNDPTAFLRAVKRYGVRSGLDREMDNA